MKNYIDYSDEVKKAKAANKPIVALESTIISHGMPYPKNIETALMCEDIIRKNNAIPATIAVINGRLKAGLTQNEIEYLAKAKISSRCQDEICLQLSHKNRMVLQL